MKILFAGTPKNAADTLQHLLAGPYEVVAVLTRPDAVVGRKRELTASPVALMAENAGIPVIKATKIDDSVRQELARFGADLGVVVAYGAIFNQAALQVPRLGWINLHYSLLPDWRGAAPVQWSILEGDTETGVTIFQLDAGMDTGAVLSTVPTAIQPGENFGQLLARLTLLGISGLDEVLPAIDAGIAKATSQNHSLRSRVATKPTRELAKINWNEPSIRIERKVLAFNPEPIAWTLFESEAFRVLDARALSSSDSLQEGMPGFDALPGTIFLAQKRVLAVCGEGTLVELKTVQPSGKKPMRATDWARGLANKELSFT